MSEYIVKCKEFTSCIGNKLQFPDYIDYSQEVVRCRDCKWGIDGGRYCAEGASDSWDWSNVEPDGFCAWGERRQL